MKPYLLKTPLCSCLWEVKDRSRWVWSSLRCCRGRKSTVRSLEESHQSGCFAVASSLDHKTSKMKWKTEEREGLATTVSTDLTNSHEIILWSVFYSVLFICFFSSKAEMHLLLNLFSVFCFETAKLISVAIFILTTSHVRGQPSSLKQIQNCLLYWLLQEFHPALVPACLFCKVDTSLEKYI